MRSIFFDLETSDKEPCGQILNFCFMVFSSDWRLEDELSGDIRLSRLQLPSADALLANRVNVIAHQEDAKYSEKEACVEIATFLDRVVGSSSDPVAFVGYNSFRFDVPYLRTTLIRNGINPYIGGPKLQYKDLFAATKKLSTTAPDFPRVVRDNTQTEEGAGARLSLKLESITKALGLLDGKQTHSSRDDVLLTVELAKEYISRFGLDVRTYDAYEARSCHQTSCKGRLFIALEPQYDLSKDEIAERVPMTVLDFDRRYSLWINLKRYMAGDGRGSIQFYKNQGSSLILDTILSGEHELEKTAQSAFSELSSINLRNFFQRSVCDVEMDIFRVDFDGIDGLNAAIWRGEKSRVKELNNKDVTALYVRHILANHRWGTAHDAAIKEKLRSYAEYRYGGKMQLSKSAAVEGGPNARHHPTLPELTGQAEERLKGSTGEDREILLALQSYYQNSEIAELLEQR